jgi:hypothetical protein
MKRLALFALVLLALPASALQWTLSPSSAAATTSAFSEYDGPQPLVMKFASGKRVNIFRRGPQHADKGRLLKRVSAGAAWGAEQEFISDPVYDTNNPFGGVTAGNVGILCHALHVVGGAFDGVNCYRSTDEGETWTGPVAMSTPQVARFGTGYGPLVNVPAGSVTCPQGCSFAVVKGYSPAWHYLVFTFDDGLTWGLARRIPPAPYGEIAFAYLGNEELIGFGRWTTWYNAGQPYDGTNPKNLLFYRSLDMGQTWTSVTSNITLHPEPAAAPGYPTTMWALVSPWMVDAPGGRKALLFAERRADTVNSKSYFKVRAILFDPRSFDPLAMPQGQVLHQTTPPGPYSFVGYGYPAVVEASPGVLQVQFYSEIPGQMNMKPELYELSAQYLCLNCTVQEMLEAQPCP